MNSKPGESLETAGMPSHMCPAIKKFIAMHTPFCLYEIQALISKQCII